MSTPQRTLSLTYALLLSSAVSYLTGCQATQLDHRTCRMSSTLSDMQYREVMDNLARTASCPNSLPYLNVATGGHTTVQQLGQATAGLGWGFVATIAKTVLNSETLGFQLSQQNVDVWDTAPSLDPVQLIAMQGLYNKALGFEMSQQQIAVLDALYTPPPPQRHRLTYPRYQ